MLHEAMIHLGNVRRGCSPIVIGVSCGASGHVQRKILDRIFLAEAAALPAVGRSSFHDKERDARSIRAARIEQGPQYFFLRGPRVNASDGGNKITLSRTSPGPWRRRGCGQFRHHASDQLSLQRWTLAVESLRHRTLDDLLKFLAFRHAQRTISNAQS